MFLAMRLAPPVFGFVSLGRPRTKTKGRRLRPTLPDPFFYGFDRLVDGGLYSQFGRV